MVTLTQVMSQALGSDSEPEIELGTGSDAEFDTAKGWGKKGRGGGLSLGTCMAYRVADLWLQSCAGTRGKEPPRQSSGGWGQRPAAVPASAQQLRRHCPSVCQHSTLLIKPS